MTKLSSIFSILLLIYAIFGNISLSPLSAVESSSQSPSFAPSPYSYDILLDQAVAKMQAFDYGRALDRLSLARRSVKAPDYRYHYIMGEIYFRMGKFTESLEAFDKSLEMEPGQIELLLKIAEFHEKDRRPYLALNYLEQYLRFLPEEKEQRYRSGVLARQSGKNDSAENHFKYLEKDTSYQYEKDAILELIRNDIYNKSWQEAIEKSKKYLLYFPRDEILHEYHILALRGSGADETILEKAIIDSASVFSENANFAVRYGIFLQEKERMLEALSAFRRAYSIALIQNQNLSNQAEIFFLIRQTYSFLDREHDARAMSSLDSIIQKSKSSAKTDSDINIENTEREEVLRAHATYPKNREILEYCIHYFQRIGDANQYNLFQGKLKERDREFEEKELIYVIGPFSREKLE